MKNMIRAVLALSLSAPASAGTWAQALAGVAGSRFLSADVPALGKTGAIAAPKRAAFSPTAAKGGLLEQAEAFADEVIRVDKALDGAYAAYRKSLSDADLDALAPLRRERDYYAGVWRSIVEPTRALPKDDARVTPVLQALYRYLSPIPARVEKLEKAKAVSAKAVEKASAATGAAEARLHEDDRKSLQQFGLIEVDWAKLEATIDPMRKESPEYMGWVKEAFETSVAWRKTVKVDASLAEQYTWVNADYVRNSKLAKDLMDKKLGVGLKRKK
ncbi:MAG: hypothetical protein HYZ75_05950 [Elusimicrobia bacterium]|nr:hypothetical protein [Elusimicrobiota bacterium]